MLRQPVTIWWHTTIELWKLLVLATAVLVGVISFAITIKPLADGELAAIDAIRFMLLATVPMLAYALPFGAGFAATLVFHRMAQDNELSASHAGGLSHRSLLAPALVSGLVLAVVVGLMSDQIIPRFLKTMERMITGDVARLMVSRLGAGETVELNGNLIYADAVQQVEPSDEMRSKGVSDAVLLYRPALGWVDEEGKLDAGATAERAWIYVYRGNDEDRGANTVVRLIASNFNSWGGRIVAESPDTLPYDFVVPGSFRDDPKFWSFAELREISRDPTKMAKINSYHHRLAIRAASLAMLEHLDRDLRENGVATVTTSQGDAVTVRARGLGGVNWLGRAILPTDRDGPVVIERRRTDGETSRSEALRAYIDTANESEITAPGVVAQIVLEEVTTTGGAADAGAGRRKGQQITGIVPEHDRTQELEALGFDELLERTGYGLESTLPAIVHIQKDAVRNEADVQREIVSKTHLRLAMSAACLVMVLVGATMAIKLREALPLTVYLWAFFPALGAVLVISMGEQFAQQSGWPGLVVMWGAVLGLLAYAGVTYRRVVLR